MTRRAPTSETERDERNDDEDGGEARRGKEPLKRRKRGTHKELNVREERAK